MISGINNFESCWDYSMSLTFFVLHNLQVGLKLECLIKERFPQDGINAWNASE